MVTSLNYRAANPKRQRDEQGQAYNKKYKTDEVARRSGYNAGIAVKASSSVCSYK
jgi:hypothetical protein